MPFPHIPSPPTQFPIYLVPALPFRRRRQSSTDSAGTVSSDGSTTSSSPPGAATSYLAGHASHLRCARCLADLAPSSQIISKGFTGRHGRAYLVGPSLTASSAPTPDNGSSTTLKALNAALPNLPNTFMHKPALRQLVTGAHTVGDIGCAHCGTVLGWKYVAAKEEAQRYKVGKFILETQRVCRSSQWEGGDDEEGEVGSGALGTKSARGRRRSENIPPDQMPGAALDETVEFDSQDEDECEDLFLGIWTPQLAAKRRKAGRFERIDEV